MTAMNPTHTCKTGNSFPVFALFALLTALSSWLAVPPARAGNDIYRYLDASGVERFTDDPGLIPRDRWSTVRVQKAPVAPAAPAGVTPLTQDEEKKEASEKDARAKEKRDRERKAVDERYRQVLLRQKAAAERERVEKARKAYDAEKAKLTAEDDALKTEYGMLLAEKAEVDKLALRKRNPRMGRQFREREAALEARMKDYEARRADLDSRLKAFAAKVRP